MSGTLLLISRITGDGEYLMVNYPLEVPEDILCSRDFFNWMVRATTRK